MRLFTQSLLVVLMYEITSHAPRSRCCSDTAAADACFLLIIPIGSQPQNRGVQACTWANWFYCMIITSAWVFCMELQKFLFSSIKTLAVCNNKPKEHADYGDARHSAATLRLVERGRGPIAAIILQYHFDPDHGVHSLLSRRC